MARKAAELVIAKEGDVLEEIDYYDGDSEELDRALALPHSLNNIVEVSEEDDLINGVYQASDLIEEYGAEKPSS